MAEAEQVSGRKEDLIKNCSPCYTKGTEIAATKYCFMCETPFCKECIEQHNVLLSDHQVTDIESATVGLPTTLQTERCQKHGRALRLYCKEHDSICCDECFDREHMSCKDVVYLPISAPEIIKTIDANEIKSKLRRTIGQLESIKLNQQETAISFETDREKCLNEVDEHHTELLDLLEKIVQSSKDQIEQTFERFSEDLQRHQREVEKCLLDLKSSENRLECKQGNDFPLFVELKKCQNQLKATVSEDALNNLKTRGFSVAVDARLHTLLSQLDSMVTVLKQAPVQVKKKYQVDVLGKKENKTCRIHGSCVLSDGSIVLADFSNCNIKCVDQHSRKVTDQCQMTSAPIDVCVINNNEVAVTQKNSTVVIVSLRPTLTTIKTISVDHHCAYVAYSEGKLFITDEKKNLYIYNLEGTLLRKVSYDSTGKDIFYKTRHIVIDTEGGKVYIADLNEGLIILDREGQFKEKLVIDKVRGAWGLCLDGRGGLFVCGFSSNNVVHVDSNGQVLAEVLTSTDGLESPLSVCYDRLNKRLIVTQYNSNQKHMCELE